MKLEELFASKAHAKLIQFMLENADKGFSQNHLARMTGLAPSTVARVCSNLESLGLVESYLLEGVKLIMLKRNSHIARALAAFHEKTRTMETPEGSDA